MSVAAQLKKLEKAAGIGERCLNCKVHYIKFGDEIRRTLPVDISLTTCASCGFEIKAIHAGFTERERKVLIYVATAKKRLMDAPQWLASYAWMNHLPRFGEIEQIGAAEEKRLRDAVKTDPSARRWVKMLDDYKLYQDRMLRIHEETKKRELKQRMRDTCAPVMEALDEVRKEQRTLDHLIFRYRVMSEMEVFMWGEKSKETLKLIEDRQHVLDEEARERKREADERERKYQEEKRQREEDRKRQHEEYLARARAQSSGSSSQTYADGSAVNPSASVSNVVERPRVMTVAESICRSQQLQRPAFLSDDALINY